MTERPEFDPRRSEAMRRMLVETVAASPQSSTRAAAGSRTRSRWRTLAIVLIAVLAGLIGTGTAALAINGQSWFGAASPAPTAQPTVPVTATPTSTPTPIATSTVAPNPPAPVVRVPATCDQLGSVADAEQILGVSLQPSEPIVFGNPASNSNQRVGSLMCAWSADSANRTGTATAAFSYEVVPGVTAEAYANYANGESWAGAQAEPAVSQDAYSHCAAEGYSFANGCAFIDLVNGYAIQFSAAPDPSEKLTDDERSALRASFVEIDQRVRALPEPGPLWQPTGPTLAGASGCDGFIGTDTLAAELGVAEVSEFKSDGGEYSSSTFGTFSQVNAFWCSWSDTQPNGTASAYASVLPGGASYFADFMAHDTEYNWMPSTDYPGEAYVSSRGGSAWVSILIDDGWLVVSAPTSAQLQAITKTVLHNVGAQ